MVNSKISIGWYKTEIEAQKAAKHYKQYNAIVKPTQLKDQKKRVIDNVFSVFVDGV